MDTCSARIRCWIAFAAAAFLATACTAPGSAGVDDKPPGSTVQATGTITSIDLQPWTYDGHAIVQVDTGQGRLDVKLPARWNLCKAPPVDVDALQVGAQVAVAGAAAGEGAVVVCENPSHRLEPVAAAR